MSAPSPDPDDDLQGSEFSMFSVPRSLKDLIGQVSVREYIQQVRNGLKQPKDSGEYKYAIHQVVRVWAPIAGIVLPILLVIAVLLAPEPAAPPPVAFTVSVMDTKVLDEALDDIKEVEPPEQPDQPIEPPPLEDFTPEQIQNMSDEQLVGGPAGPSVGPGSGPGASGASADFSPQPAMFDTVAMIKSPIKMTGIMGSRTPGARGKALAQYGGGGGGGSGGAATEQAVYLALRWLKKYQESDGSWTTASGGSARQNDGAAPAMTGFALLTFLAHGETPASEEFGPTVERAIKWLLENQTPEGHFKGADNHDYSMPIATYALCEAYALTRIPMVKAAAEKAVAAIIKGQNKGGLWNYNFDPKIELKANSTAAERQDLSFGAWCLQALKAAKMGGLEVSGLEESLKRGAEGVKSMGNVWADGTRAFGYGRTDGGPYGPWEITGAGTLCLQLLGYGKSKEVNEAQLWLRRATCDWAKPWMDERDKDGQPSGNPVYHWYYVTQAKFHAGGATWADWNKQFSPQLVRNQIVIKNAIEDAKGNLVDIGYWRPVTPKEHCQSFVYTTALCALQLQVYYRYLPTYKTPEAVTEGPSTLEDKDKDVEIEIL